MKTIHKIQIPIGEAVVVEMPVGATVVHADFKFAADDDLTLWYERDVDEDATEARAFVVVPTGAPFLDDGVYVATVISANRYFVAHLIEVS